MATGPKAAKVPRSYRALHISWPTRWRLESSARSDRRAGLPIGLNADTTPVLRELLARRDEGCEHERSRYLKAVQRLTVRLAQLDAEVTSLERLLEERTADLARATVRPNEQQLTLSHAGEENLPPALVQRRRETEHRRRADAAIAAQADAQQRLDSARRERAQVEAQRQARADVARSRVLRYVDQADRLAAIYRRALIHRHRDHAALVQAWSADLHPTPAWVLGDELPPARTTGATA